VADTITCPACGAEAASNAGFCFGCGKGFRGKYLLAEDEARRMIERGIASPPAPTMATVGLARGTTGAPTPSQSMQYRAVPFRAVLQSNQGVDTAANQLEAAINAHAAKGWTFCSVAQVHALVQPGLSRRSLGSHRRISRPRLHRVRSASAREAGTIVNTDRNEELPLLRRGDPGRGNRL